MNLTKSLWAACQGDPKAMQNLHKWLTILWVVPGLPISFLLRQSVPYLVGLSVYAIIAGHWAAWQAARVEVRQEQAE